MRGRRILIGVTLTAWMTSAPLEAEDAVRVPDPSSTDPNVPRPKRVAPPNVAPIVLGGVRIEVIQWGRSRGLGQNGGYIAAIDVGTGRQLWTLKVYDVAYDPRMEEDVQDVFIAKMTKGTRNRLAIVDEKGRRYLVDVKARTVTPH
jgi:hypothetical protein